MKTESYAEELIKQLIPAGNEVLMYCMATEPGQELDIDLVPIKFWALVEERQELNIMYDEDVEVSTCIKPVTIEGKHIDLSEDIDEDYLVCIIDLDKEPDKSIAALKIKYKIKIEEQVNKIHKKIQKRVQAELKNAGGK